MKFSYIKNRESEIFYKESKSNKKKKSGGLEGRDGGVARVSDFFFLFSKESKSEKKIVSFLRE